MSLRSALASDALGGDARSLSPAASVLSRAIIGITGLVANGSTADAASFATASITPTANRLVLAGILNHQAAGGPATPTLTGNGLTWVQVATVTVGQRRLTVFRAMGAAPSAGAVTVDFGADAQTAVVWSIVELSAVPTTGANGADAVVQSDTTSAAANTTTNATYGAPMEHAANMSVAFVGLAVATGVTPDPQFTEVPGHDVSQLTTNVGIQCEYAYGQATCDPTFGSSASVIAMVEVKAA